MNFSNSKIMMMSLKIYFEWIDDVQVVFCWMTVTFFYSFFLKNMKVSWYLRKELKVNYCHVDSLMFILFQHVFFSIVTNLFILIQVVAQHFSHMFSSILHNLILYFQLCTMIVWRKRIRILWNEKKNWERKWKLKHPSPMFWNSNEKKIKPENTN